MILILVMIINIKNYQIQQNIQITYPKYLETLMTFLKIANLKKILILLYLWKIFSNKMEKTVKLFKKKKNFMFKSPNLKIYSLNLKKRSKRHTNKSKNGNSIKIAF